MLFSAISSNPFAKKSLPTDLFHAITSLTDSILGHFDICPINQEIAILWVKNGGNGLTSVSNSSFLERGAVEKQFGLQAENPTLHSRLFHGKMLYGLKNWLLQVALQMRS